VGLATRRRRRKKETKKKREGKRFVCGLVMDIGGCIF
jgi:hypothetical protein